MKFCICRRILDIYSQGLLISFRNELLVNLGRQVQTHTPTVVQRGMVEAPP